MDTSNTDGDRATTTSEPLAKIGQGTSEREMLEDDGPTGATVVYGCFAVACIVCFVIGFVVRGCTLN